MAKQFTDQNFQEDVINASSHKPVLVDFFADWCGPCKMQGPVIDNLSEEMEGKAILGKLDVQQSVSVSSAYRVMSIPTILIFKNGEVVEQFVGLRSKDDLRSALEKYM